MVREKLKALVREYEGKRDRVYKDPGGLLTVGIGHLVTPADRLRFNQKISEKEIEVLFEQDLRIARLGVRSALSPAIFRKLTENQIDALTSFVFNVGAAKFNKSTMARLLNQGKFTAAADQFDRWVYQGKVKLRGLVRRRAAEKSLFVSK